MLCITHFLRQFKQTLLKIIISLFMKLSYCVKKNIMVPEVECIYYLDGVWRVWMHYKKSWVDFQQSTFWQREATTWSKAKVNVCIMYMLLNHTNQPSWWDGFRSVSLQITVLFVYVCFSLAFFLLAIVWLSLLPVTVFCFFNRNWKCYVMNCKYSVRLYACLSFF